MSMRWMMMALMLMGCPKKTEPPAPEPEPASAPDPEPKEEIEFGPVVDAVNFDSGVTEVKASEMGAIDQAAGILKSGDWKVIVVGLADSSGDVEANKVLSQQRADAVAAELRKRVDLTDERIQVRGIGERLATGATQSERKVEFVFYKDEGEMPVKQIVVRSRVLEQDFREKRAQ
jgi:outer membrane protein OmpA-like peptidoglycan-associated protein